MNTLGRRLKTAVLMNGSGWKPGWDELLVPGFRQGQMAIQDT